MGLLFKKYKTKFRYSLQPIFAMLVDRRRTLPAQKWIAMVERTRVSIINNPVEFLGTEFPEPGLLRDIIDEIFFEFLKEQRQLIAG